MQRVAQRMVWLNRYLHVQMSLEKYIHTHCFGHALNLSVGDCIKQRKVMKMAIEVVGEISKLLEKLLKRDSSFDRIKSALAPDTRGFCALCLTRSTVNAAKLKSMIDNYEVLLEVWEGTQRGTLMAR